MAPHLYRNRPFVRTLLTGTLAVGAAAILTWWYLPLLEPKATLAPSLSASTPPPPAATAAPTYVGSTRCAGCHEQQLQSWNGSHHALSMQPAAEKTVLGDFKDATFLYGTVLTRFFRRDGRFFVHTDGPDGALQEFEVKYTFGVYPLQQYLLELPGGRLQAFTITWDTRPREQGGQRWFHQNPEGGVTFRDELHWTRAPQNWNSRCAECHSTGLTKGFDLGKNQFDTRWAEVNVACEACHGPASRHLQWAKEGDRTARPGHRGIIERFANRPTATLTVAERAAPVTYNAEVEACARCHARRSALTEDYVHGQPITSTHLPDAVIPPTFHVDGQIREEDFEYASFRQSKMFHAGVSCTSCHDPHSQKLRAEGNALCASCHSSSKFDDPQHHHHAVGSTGASCVGCHMPTTNFMVVHARHDHSLRIPRPDLSVELGSPNACTQCHSTQTNDWARKSALKWYGPKREHTPHYGQVLGAALRGAPGSSAQLLELALNPSSPSAPGVIRAASLELLSRAPTEAAIEVLPVLLSDGDPLIRRAALSVVEGLPEPQRWPLVLPLLEDPSLAVRAEAARIAAPSLQGSARGNEEQTQRILAGVAIYLRIAEENGEEAQSHVNLAQLYQSLQDDAAAERSYRTALRLDPNYVVAAVNFAQFLAEHGSHEAAGELLLSLRARLTPNAALEHALGLHYIRVKQGAEAREALENAVRLAPNEPRFAYVLAVAENESGDGAAAVRRLEALARRFPNDVSILQALVAFLRTKTPAKARPYAERLVKLQPDLGPVEQMLSAP